MDLATLRQAGDTVNNRATRVPVVSGDFSFKIGGYEYPSRGDPQKLQINTMHASPLGDNSVWKTLE